MLVPRWKGEFDYSDRPRVVDLRDRHRDADPRDHRRTLPSPFPPSRSEASTHPSPDRPPPPPLSSSYDPSKISSQPHPVTKKITRCYTKPNGKTIYLNRNCSPWSEAHFDFEHDSLHASARFGFDESGYEEWECESDTIAGDPPSSL